MMTLDLTCLSQLHELEAMMQATRDSMRKLLLELRQYAESRYNVTNEVAIYDKLLGFEETRLSTPHPRVNIFNKEMTSVDHDFHTENCDCALQHGAPRVPFRELQT